MKNLTGFMASRNLPLDPNPNVDGRPIHLPKLFHIVFNNFGGYRNITQNNLWPQVWPMLGYPPQQQTPTTAQQIRAIYERNLVRFEEAWGSQQKMRQQQQGGMPNTANVQQPTPTKPMPHQIQPNPMMQPGAQPQIQHGQAQSPMKPQNMQQTNVNGFPAPHLQQQLNAAQGHTRNSFSRSSQPTPTGDEFQLSSPAHAKPGSIPLPGSSHAESQPMPDQDTTPMRFPAPFATDPEEYMPCSRELTTFGGVDLGAVEKYAEELQKNKLDVPPLVELGNIDIQALTRSIQSGIHGEVRLGLDVLGQVSATAPDGKQPYLQIELKYCDDLVDTLIECAEEQVELLVENSEEASNEITISPYEDVIRACRIEKLLVRNVPRFGSQAYELDHAVDRLIAITTILRNLSFWDENQPFLADETVVKFLCVVIRYLGTREMLLRTQVNTLDFMKDIIILLSNVSSSMEIPGREQAFCLLQFLLAFAPSPAPALSGDRLFFTSYEPALHPYLPHAVDALAKLLARDEPNRTHYKAIFAAEVGVNSSPPSELLTRTFALAISPIPDHHRDSRPPNMPSVVEARKPLLMQSLLAADILASLAPGYESGVTRLWLFSGNGFAQNLFGLARQLGAQYEGQLGGRPGGGSGPRSRPSKDVDLIYIVTLAISTLKRLSEKARDPNNPAGEDSIPPNAVPGTERILALLQMNAPDWNKGMLADLISYANLVD